FYPVDLQEVAIQVIGESDGVFNNDDFILMYAEGLDQWSEENRTNLNLYDTKSYYYVTFGGENGKRMQLLQEPEGPVTTNITTFNDYQFHERDLVNIGRLGRKWFGETFSAQSSQSFQFNLPNLVQTEPITIRIEAAGEAPIPTSMNVSVNGQNTGTLNFLGVNPNSGTLFWDVDTTISVNGSENLTLQLTYNNGGIPSARGFLNYINVRSVRNLRGFGKQFMFTNNTTASQLGIGEYQLSNANGISQIWEITDRFNPTFIPTNNQASFAFKSQLGSQKTFIALDPTDLFVPLRDNTSRVTNQNLMGTIFNDVTGQFRDIDYLIITPAFLSSEAERLANFHRNFSDLNVKVVTLEQIYPEFSSGKQDIGAIRNFVKYVYKNASQPNRRVRYLNLFGDASFDFKNRIPNNTNIVPVFHTINSNNLSASQMTDDFFTMMDDNEGVMNSAAHKMDIAVGRMLVSNLQQAREMVNKVIEYHDENSYGRWRNNFTLISDDVDESWEGVIQSQLDQLGNTIGAEIPTVNVFKIHADAYVQEVSSGGQRYPRVREEIISAFERGSLVFNYFGHGGEDFLAKERIFDRADAQNLNNRYRYPLFVTVTCEFTRFDNPFRPTAGEFTYWNPRGGAVSLLTTTRRIDVTTGQNINRDFAGNLYGYAANVEQDISIAEALRISKNQYPSQTLMVFYIGDPALKLARPKPSIALTHINGVPVNESNFVFNALSPVTLKGEVRNETNTQIISNFNGELAVQIFDKEQQRTTLANDNTTNAAGNLILMNFSTLGETIFRGNASVTNGQFEFNFIVPRDIKIPVGNGRISFYAKRNQLFQEDRSGVNTDILIGGLNANAAADNLAPRVRLYMNDETFVSGGITDRNPIFLAFLEDESGI
ncbi:MAG: type IX secretion system sortase PorU, partial [Flavobacterium sp.]